MIGPRAVVTVHPADARPAIVRGAPVLVILTGARDSGKTATLARWVEEWRAAGLDVGGVVSRAVLEHGVKTGFDAVEIATGQAHPLVRSAPFDGGAHHCGFHFDTAGFASLNARLIAAPARDLLVLDEIGPVELRLRQGLYPALVHALREPSSSLLVVVRPSCLDDFVTLAMTV